MKTKWNNFISSLVFCILLPLMYLLLQCLFGEVTYKDIVLTAALYPISLFIASKNSGLFSVGVLLALIFSFGLAFHEENINFKIFAIISIAGMAVMHIIERIMIHLVRNEKFFNFE